MGYTLPFWGTGHVTCRSHKTNASMELLGDRSLSHGHPWANSSLDTYTKCTLHSPRRLLLVLRSPAIRSALTFILLLAWAERIFGPSRCMRPGSSDFGDRCMRPR